MLLTGKLAEHAVEIDKAAVEIAERIRADYLKACPMPDGDTMERIRISAQAQMIADEIVIVYLICI